MTDIPHRYIVLTPVYRNSEEVWATIPLAPSYYDLGGLPVGSVVRCGLKPPGGNETLLVLSSEGDPQTTGGGILISDRWGAMTVQLALPPHRLDGLQSGTWTGDLTVTTAEGATYNRIDITVPIADGTTPLES